MMHQLRGALDEVQLPIKNVILFLDGSLEKQQADVVHPLENVEVSHSHSLFSYSGRIDRMRVSNCGKDRFGRVFIERRTSERKRME